MNMSELMLNIEPNKLPNIPTDAVHVAVGVIFNSKQDQILIAKRPNISIRVGYGSFPVVRSVPVKP